LRKCAIFPHLVKRLKKYFSFACKKRPSNDAKGLLLPQPPLIDEKSFDKEGQIRHSHFKGYIPLE
jgi:hypothetical protein